MTEVDDEDHGCMGFNKRLIITERLNVFMWREPMNPSYHPRNSIAHRNSESRERSSRRMLKVMKYGRGSHRVNIFGERNAGAHADMR